jgi:hypothetical protein
MKGTPSMIKTSSRRGRFGLLLATFAVVGVAVAYYSATTASADGRTLTGDFCTTPNMFCMTITWDGVAYGTPNRADPGLRPGTYWLTLNDTAAFHDFALRSCSGSTMTCDRLNPLGTETELTTPAEVDTTTVKLLLTHGTYRLYCDVGSTNPDPTKSHEGRGMYVDFSVSGEGQEGDFG